MTAMAKEDDRSTYTSDSELSDNETRRIRRCLKKSERRKSRRQVRRRRKLDSTGKIVKTSTWVAPLVVQTQSVSRRDRLCEKKIIIANGDWKQPVFWVDN